MRILVAIVGLVFSSFLIGRLAYQLRTSKLCDRRWRAYTNRQDNPMLYWSSIILESLIALMLLSIWMLGIAGTKN